MKRNKLFAAAVALVVALVAWKSRRPRPPQADSGSWEPVSDVTADH